MLTQFRHIALGGIALAAVWAGAALAQWPGGSAAVARLAPGFGGVCEACDLSGRVLAGARMTNAIFNETDFSGAVLQGADASHSPFIGANFNDADISYATLVRARFVRATFEGAKMAHVNAHGADFTRARLDRADLSGADLRGARGLTQAQLDGACGDGATRLPPGLHVTACG